jgi:hypothetical protein
LKLREEIAHSAQYHSPALEVVRVRRRDPPP